MHAGNQFFAFCVALLRKQDVRILGGSLRGRRVLVWAGSSSSAPQLRPEVIPARQSSGVVWSLNVLVRGISAPNTASNQ